MARSFDGIKKLNPAEAKKYRKIVLSHALKTDSAAADNQTKALQPGSSAKRVDGIKFNKINSFPSENIMTPEENERFKQAIKRQEEERRRVKEEEKQYRLRKARAEKERRQEEQREINRQENERKEIIIQAERAAREEIQFKAAKELAERIKLEEIRAEKRKIARLKAWEKFKKNFENRSEAIYFAVKRNFVFGFLLLAVGLSVFYAIFCLAVLRFKVDNNFTKKLSGYFLAPAAITNQGVISYADFKNLREKGYLGLAPEEKKDFLAKWIILRNLAKKYGLALNGLSNDLSLKFIMDEEFNRIGLARINKIGSLLKGSRSLESAGKYADKYVSGVYFTGSADFEKFRPLASRLAIGQISNIIPDTDGFYIIEKINDKNGRLGVNYLFVKARTLESYVNEKSESVGVFILMN